MRIPRPRAPRLVSLSTLLGVGLGALMALAVASVMVVGFTSARRNTFELLTDKARLILDLLEQRVRGELGPVEAQANYLRTLMETGRLDPADRAALDTALLTSLAAAPQVAHVIFIGPDLSAVRASREGNVVAPEDMSGREGVRAMVEAAREGRGTGWRPPIWSGELRQTVVRLVTPVMRDGRFLGVVMPVVLISDLSAYLARVSDQGQMAFVLYGEERVLAHPILQAGDPNGSLLRPLTPIGEIADPVLRQMWSAERREIPDLSQRGDRGHSIPVGDGYSVFIFRPLRAYGEVPWIVGAAIPEDSAGGEIRRLQSMTIIGLVLLLLSVIAAVLAGRRIARPIDALVDVTEHVRAFDFAGAPKMPRSRIRELDVAGDALNAMVTALRWFELYLPKSLVRRLLVSGEEPVAHADARDVTVMFTDIEGFSERAAKLDPYQTAAFLNEHFGLIGGCVDETLGTIDKYIGDAVMAFWGAPDAQGDHAERACRAALAIAAALEAHNSALPEGTEPVRVRIGISTGRVLVGNIGAPGRVNFTLVGDVVNLAERLEQLGKEMDGPGPQILLSDPTRAALPPDMDLDDIGERAVRGRGEAVRVWRLRLSRDNLTDVGFSSGGEASPEP